MTPQAVARQAPLSMGFSRQEYWSGEPLPSPGDPPNPGIEPRSPTLQADSLPTEPQGKPNIGEIHHYYRLDNLARIDYPWASLETACSAGDPGSIHRLGRSSGERNVNLLQYSCLGNLMDRGNSWATVHGETRDGHDLATKLLLI